MTDPIDTQAHETRLEPAATQSVAEKPRSNIFKAGLAGAGLLALGLVAGVGGTVALSPSPTATLDNPVAVNSMTDRSKVTVQGKVAEVFGNKFVLADNSGRALVDTGWRGEDSDLVRAGETVTIQGRFDHGFVKGDVLVAGDGDAISLKPPKPGPRGWAERLGSGRIKLAEAPPAP